MYTRQNKLGLFIYTDIILLVCLDCPQIQTHLLHKQIHEREGASTMSISKGPTPAFIKAQMLSRPLYNSVSLDYIKEGMASQEPIKTS